MGRRGRFPVVCGAPATVIGRGLSSICPGHAAVLLGRRWHELAVPSCGLYFLPSYFEWVGSAVELDGSVDGGTDG